MARTSKITRTNAFAVVATMLLALLAVVLAPPAPSADALTVGTTQLFTVGGIAHDGSVLGVSCVPAVGAVPAGCVSVGSNEGIQKPLVVVGEGATQTAAYADAAGGRHWLADVACVTSTSCVAVGYADATTGNHQYIVEYSGGTWTRVAAIDPVNFSPTGGWGIQLKNLSCTDFDNCVAVGSYIGNASAVPANSIRPIAYSKVAGTWSVQVVEPAGATFTTATNVSRFTDIECVSTTRCYATGTYATGSGTARNPFVATGTVSNGAMSWTTSDIPLSDYQSFTDYYLEDVVVDCASANYCVVAGNYIDTSAVKKNFFWELTNGTFAASAAGFDPNPTNRTGITDIVCPEAGLCYATASTLDATTGGIITLTNGTPAFQALAKANDISGRLQSISCPNSATCAVAGYGKESGGQNHVTIGALENGTWSMNPTFPMLASEYDAGVRSITSLDCRLDGQCLLGSSNRANNAWRATLTDFTITVSTPSTTSTTAAPTTSTTAVATTSTTVAADSSTTIATGSPTADQLRALPERSLADSQLRPGSSFTARSDGFTTGTTVNLWMASEPMLLGTGVVDADGVIAIAAVVPTDAPAGDHTLALLASDGSIGWRQPVSIVASGSALPFTGSDSLGLVLGALALLALGLGLAVVARRRLTTV